MPKKSKSKPQPANKQLKWIVIIAAIVVVTGLTYWFINSDTNTKDESTTKAKSTSELSPDLIKANKLTQDVYYYVEQVEMKKMTQEEANQKSNPIKAELQSVRSQLSKEELMYNDSIRKVLGNIMVENVMKWRTDNGLIKPEDKNGIQSGN
jgi:flagellar basal body-associated protein FliL